jgi:GDP-L-fucose synthase
MYKVLVTGAAGFVGRHIVKRLLDDGHEVHAVDSLTPLTGARDPKEGWPLFEPLQYEQFRFYRQDCREWFATCHDTDFDYVYHLAAMVGGRMMIENNPLVVADDLSIDAAYWQWVAATRPGKAVCFSSSAAYPISLQREHEYVLLQENMIDFDGALGIPDMSYGWAKLTSEYLARLAHERYGLRTICFRPFSGYGEDQDNAYPFPSICQRVLDTEDGRILDIWGSGRQMRDFIHIDDCIHGIMMMVDRIDDGRAVNLSTGRLTSFIELASAAATAAGYYPVIRGLSEKPEGVFARGGDVSLQRAFGFTAQITLEDGIDRAMRYYEKKRGTVL